MVLQDQAQLQKLPNASIWTACVLYTRLDPWKIHGEMALIAQ